LYGAWYPKEKLGMVYPALLGMYKVSVQFTPKKLRRLYSAEIN